MVGGGNSAGQAAVFLAQTTRRVHMLVRGGGLADTMSRYLIRRIEENPAIELHTRTEIVALEGDGALARVHWRDAATARTEARDIKHVFIMTGAVPNTEWLAGCVTLDANGFVGRIGPVAGGRPRRKRGRAAHLLETGLPALRGRASAAAASGRVASAVGGDRSRSRSSTVLHE